MTIGDKHERLRIVRKSRSQSNTGAYVVTDTTVATRWASVEPVAAREGEQAGRIRGAVTYLIEMDLRGITLTPDDKLVWVTRSNTTLNIREVRISTVKDTDTTIVADSGAVNSG